MATYFCRESFNKVAETHAEIIGHRVSVSENAMYEIVSSDADSALSMHGAILLRRSTEQNVDEFIDDDDVLLTKHRSCDGDIFIVTTFFDMHSTEVCMPCEVLDLLCSEEEASRF